jgi:hypothetical protein
MTISSQTRTAGPYTGTGLVTAYPFAFKVFSGADLVVQRIDLAGALSTLVLTADYTVALNADQNAAPGGTINLTTALAAGFQLTATSAVPLTQPASITNGGGFYPRVIEDQFDRTVILAQQQQVAINQSLRVPDINGMSPMVETATARANSFLRFDGSGQPVAYKGDPTSSTALAADLASTASGKGAALVAFQGGGTVQDLASTASGKGAALVGTEGGSTVQADLRGRLRDIRSFPGIAANGITDDSTAFKAACVTARAGGYGIWFPEGVYCLIEFATALSQVFVSGPVSLVGAHGQRCGFILDKKVDNVPVIHDPLFCFGITSKGSAVDAWTGRLERIGFVLKAGCKRFERCCHFYEWQNATVRDCWYDGRAVTFTAAQFSGGFLSSNEQPTWATGQTGSYSGVQVIGNTGYASAYYQNSESIAFTNLKDSIIAFNKVYGFADDLAIHGGTNISVLYNINKPLAGRYYAEDVSGLLLHGNHLERCKDPSGAYMTGTLTGIRLSHTPTYAVSNAAPANTNVVITNNRVVMPEGSYMNTAIYCENVQDGLIVRGNVLESQGTTGTADAATSAISVVQNTTLGAWVGPAGNPDSGTGGVVRCRNVQIDGNICIGSGWSATEGNIGVSMTAGATAALGPFEIKSNIAGAYFIPYNTINFSADNRAMIVSTDAFKNVSVISLLRTVPVVHRSVMTAAMNLNFAGHPIGAPADLLDDGGLDFLANSAGSLRGCRVRVAAAAIASNFCLIRILKNGVQLGVDTTFATITPTTNFVSYTVNFFGATMTFAAQDKLKVQIYFASGQTVALTGTVELFALYNGT